MQTPKRKMIIPKKWVGKNYFLNDLSFVALIQMDDAQVNIAVVQNNNKPAGFIVELTQKSFLILREHKLI